MNPNVHNRLEEIRNSGLALDFNRVLNDAVETFKKTFAWSALAIFLVSGFILASVMVILILVFGLDNLQSDPNTLNLLLIDPTNLLIYVAGVSVLGGLLAPLNAGLLEIHHRASRNLPVNLGTIFSPYATHFGKLFLLGLIVSIISTAISTGIERLHFFGFEAVNVLFSIFFSLFTCMAIPLTLYGNASPLEALSGSSLIVSRGFAPVFGLFIIGLFAAMSGLLLCCIGIIFTVSATYAIQHAIYKSSIGFGPESEKSADTEIL